VKPLRFFRRSQGRLRSIRFIFCLKIRDTFSLFPDLQNKSAAGLRMEMLFRTMQVWTRTRKEQSVAAGAAALHTLYFLFEIYYGTLIYFFHESCSPAFSLNKRRRHAPVSR